MEQIRTCLAQTYDTPLDLNLALVQRNDISPPPTLLTLPDRDDHLNLVVASSEGGLEFSWKMAASSKALAQDGFSGAELFWVSNDGSPHLISDVYGQYRAAWPNNTCVSLSLTAFPTDFAKAEVVSGGQFRYETHVKYLVRLFFLLPARPVQQSPSLPLRATLELASRLADLNDTPFPFDVRLSFPKTPSLALWTTSHLLSLASPYFRRLFGSDFSESAKRTTAEYEADSCKSAHGPPRDEYDDHYDSDDEADELYASSRSVLPTPPPADLRYHEITITEASYSTYKALLVYLQTGYTSFAPLSSTFYRSVGSPPSAAEKATSTLHPSSTPSTLAATTRRNFLRTTHLDNPSLPIPSSPKSLYALADFLDLPTLSILALSNYRSQLTPENVLLELFVMGAGEGSAANKHDEIRAAAVKYVKEHGGEVRKTKEYEEVLGKLRSGEVKAGGAVVAELVPYLLGGGESGNGK